MVLTSDNGYHMGEKDYLFKNSLWDRSCRVPFIASGPGAAAGAECSQPVSLLDIFPTMVDWCRLPADTGALPLDGTSFAHLLARPDETADVCAISAVASDTPLDAGQRGVPADQHYSVRSATHRYIRCRNGEEELYDHRTDPNEVHNRASDPACADQKTVFKNALESTLPPS